MIHLRLSLASVLLVLPMLIFKKVLAEQRGNNARRGNPGASWP